jgi:uncharacterized membrane protein YhaH (DUF805 family)
MAKENTPIAWAVLPLSKYAQFSGRSTRAEFWWFSLACFVVGFLVDAIDMAMGSEIGLIGMVYGLGLFIPTISVSVRRLHDTNRSGWWILVPVVPAVIFGFLTTAAKLDSVLDPSGTASTTAISTSMFVPLIAFLFACLIVTIFMFLPGNKAANRFGSDPYSDDQFRQVTI